MYLASTTILVEVVFRYQLGQDLTWPGQLGHMSFLTQLPIETLLFYCDSNSCEGS